jgi:DNA-binding CsgD family transcriptional regulator
LSQILAGQALAGVSVGDVVAIDAAAREGCDLADAIGDDSNARLCRLALAQALLYRGEPARAVAQLREVAKEATAAHDPFCRGSALVGEAFSLVYLGDVDGAQAVVDALAEDPSNLGELFDRSGYAAVGTMRLAAGDAAAAHDAYEAALQRTPLTALTVSIYPFLPLPPLACGDLTAARRRADDVVALAKGISLVAALTCRARVEIAQGEVEQADVDALEALNVAADSHGYVTVPDAFECLAYVAGDAGNSREAARLFGAADAARRQTGVARFKVLDADHEVRLEAVRDSLGEGDFRAAWDEGAALTIEEGIAYVRRGRAERKRPSKGWASLTPTELDVVRLACEGLGNKEIATRLFVSPRTVQAHLSHIYSKLGVSSRVQLAQEANRH